MFRLGDIVAEVGRSRLSMVVEIDALITIAWKPRGCRVVEKAVHPSMLVMIRRA